MCVLGGGGLAIADSTVSAYFAFVLTTRAKIVTHVKHFLDSCCTSLHDSCVQRCKLPYLRANHCLGVIYTYIHTHKKREIHTRLLT